MDGTRFNGLDRDTQKNVFVLIESQAEVEGVENRKSPTAPDVSSTLIKTPPTRSSESPD